MKEIAITENHLYQKTFQRGKRWSGRYVTVCVLKDLAARRLMKAHPDKRYVNRIGLSVPKREGGAVERNRVKRIIREGLRAIVREGNLKCGYLVVISARRGIEAKKSRDVEADLRYVLRKLEMFRDQTSGQAQGKAKPLANERKSPCKNEPHSPLETKLGKTLP